MSVRQRKPYLNEQGDTELCDCCAGSGSGMSGDTDYSRCSACGGSGVIMETIEREYEADDDYREWE